MNKLVYNPDALSSFEKEWGIHKGCKEWWYATAVLFDEAGNMYSCQYTLLHITFGIVTAKIAMLALTDYKNSRHYYLQTPATKSNQLIVTENQACMQGIASAVKKEDHMELTLCHKDFRLTLDAAYGKGAFWHCDNGKLQMGIPGRKETTLYYSYTNMPTTGTLLLGGKTIRLTGKTWFDKQGGTYSITNMKTHWEWFSLRFFDDEEFMLFTFPQDGYFDGTYITKDAKRERLNKYTIEQTAVTRFGGLQWSAGWRLHTELKEKDYTIEPVQQGHMNFAYFEELCSIKNAKGELVGYCFAELLPGVLNSMKNREKTAGEQTSISVRNLFKRVEY